MKRDNFLKGGKKYIAPEIETIEIAVEKGFAASNDSAGWDESGFNEGSW